MIFVFRWVKVGYLETNPYPFKTWLCVLVLLYCTVVCRWMSCDWPSPDESYQLSKKKGLMISEVEYKLKQADGLTEAEKKRQRVAHCFITIMFS